MIDPKNEQAYRKLEAPMDAAARRYDFKERERLAAEQKKLTFFRPWMTHSFTEDAKHVVFHAQLLADFNTIDELGHKMLDELAR
jgi:hypothetical protein